MSRIFRQTNTISRRTLLATSAGAVLAHPVLRGLGRASPSQPKTRNRLPIDVERFVADCVEAAREDEAQIAVREVLARGVNDPGPMLAAVGEPKRAGIEVLHRSSTLTILSASCTPQMNLMPHNHLMWALIGIYTGREDNIFWSRRGNGIKAETAECLFEGDVATLPEAAIHSVTNPLRRMTGGIHIYGGDFFATTRSQWNPETLEEEPSDGDSIRAMFARENERMKRFEDSSTEPD